MGVDRKRVAMTRIMLTAGHVAVAGIHLTNDLRAARHLHGVIGKFTRDGGRSVSTQYVDHRSPVSIKTGSARLSNNGFGEYFIIFGFINLNLYVCIIKIIFSQIY